jgi:hypothetical protein
MMVIRLTQHMTNFEVATHKLRNSALNIDEAEKCFEKELKIHAVILSRANVVERTTSLLQSEETSRTFDIVQSGTNKSLVSI